jgi:uncharacterized protein YbdZ (MbtH family)
MFIMLNYIRREVKTVAKKENQNYSLYERYPEMRTGWRIELHPESKKYLDRICHQHG